MHYFAGAVPEENRMELHQLNIFLAVAETGKFSQAAERMYLTQPAVSMQIRALEDELGQMLFYRDRRHSTLTAAGTVLLRHAQAVTTQIEQAVQEIEDLRELDGGHINIACSDTFAAYLLTDMISRFRLAFPNIHFAVYNGTSHEIARHIIDHDADIGFLSLPFHHPKGDCRNWVTYRDLAVCHPHHPVAGRDSLDILELVSEQLLILETGTATRESFDAVLMLEGVVADRVMELGSVAVQKEFATAGIGVAVVPDYAVKSDCKEGKLACIPVNGLPEKQIGLCYLRGKQLSKAAQTFIERSSTRN